MAKQPLVTISVIHYSEKGGFSTIELLEPLFQNLRKQQYKNVELFCIDNASTDTRYKEILNQFPEVTLIQLKANKGTCAHNEVYRRMKGEYLWCITLDTSYHHDYLSTLVSAAEKDTTIGSLSGTLYQADNGKYLIDSQGIGARRSHHFFERGHNKHVTPERLPKRPKRVFGLSGATTLFRKEALDAIVQYKNQVWDEHFFMYKEDVDVAYRLNLAGWNNMLVPKAIGYHTRTVKEARKAKGQNVRRLLNRSNKSLLNRKLSLRNHLYLLYKNLQKDTSMWTRLRVLWDESRRFVWVLLFERKLLSAYKEYWSTRKTLEPSRTTVSSKSLSSLFT